MKSLETSGSNVGTPFKRVDGRLKVTGQAKYAGDFTEPGLLQAVIFTSTIASGKIKSFDLKAARAVPGVVEILTFENAPRLPKPKKQMAAGVGESFLPLQSSEVFYNGQFIGAVFAETLEAAHEAAQRVQVTYAASPAKLDFDNLLATGHDPGSFNGEKLSKKRGEGSAALAHADVRVDARYLIPTENHNPLEPMSTVAWLRGDNLLIYDATQGVSATNDQFAHLARLKNDNVTTITKFVGGGFGCKGSYWPQKAIALMGTMKTKRPVKVVITREQMFTGAGSRARSIQDLSLGAKKDGTLVAIKHDTYNHTAINKDFAEPCESATPMLYQCANVQTKHIVVPLNYIAPTYMRAPGHSTGSFSLESAMDELAVKLKLDPVTLRLINYAEIDQDKKKPFTSKSLKECYTQAAEKFGWATVSREPRSRREGDWWIGSGMATATYPAQRFNAKATVKILTNGRAEVRSATQDIGTGTYTIMKQIAADHLGLKFDDVDFDLGNSHYPESGVSGGSTTASSVGSAVALACQDVVGQLKKLASKKGALEGLNVSEMVMKDGALWAGKKSIPYAKLIAVNGGKSVEGDGKVGLFDMLKNKQFGDSGHAFGAQFAEVRVHALTGEVRVNRMCSAFACGKILNPLTALSQFEGGMIFGLGMTLLEEVIEDTRNGRLAVKDLADYHMPVQADIPQLDVIMVDEKDDKINPIGTKGIGEIGITGVAAAVANAVYNATGVRIRELPITPSKMVHFLNEKT